MLFLACLLCVWSTKLVCAPATEQPPTGRHPTVVGLWSTTAKSRKAYRNRNIGRKDFPCVRVPSISNFYPNVTSCAPFSPNQTPRNIFDTTRSARTSIAKGIKPTFDGQYAVTLSPERSVAVAAHCLLRRSCGRKGTQIVLNGWPRLFFLVSVVD